MLYGKDGIATRCKKTSWIGYPLPESGRAKARPFWYFKNDARTYNNLMIGIMVLTDTRPAATRFSVLASITSALVEIASRILANLPELSIIKSDRGSNIPIASEVMVLSCSRTCPCALDKTVLA